MSSAVDEAGTPPLRERVYAVLRDDVVNGDIGAGTRLTEPKLAARFGISRTPVREALGRLVADGLLQREEDYGYSVVVPDLAGCVTSGRSASRSSCAGSTGAGRTRAPCTTPERSGRSWPAGTG